MTMVELAVGDAVAVEKGGSLLRGGVVKKFNDGMQIMVKQFLLLVGKGW